MPITEAQAAKPFPRSRVQRSSRALLPQFSTVCLAANEMKSLLSIPALSLTLVMHKTQIPSLN
jgi:hypothetical protein